MRFFFQILLFLLIFAFAAGFYIIWDHTDYNVCKQGGDIWKQERNEYYRCPFYGTGSSIVKTFTMFSGEIDYNFIFPPFDPSKHDLPKFLYQIYLGAFIFFIAIALNNFLNAVAVSDVALLREESELINQIQRVDIIMSYEELSQRYVR